jgi:DNA mismatch repair protein MutL
MGKVLVLPAGVIAKIAAGEVIDRPASAVKELVENALDAGAGRIDLKLREAGKNSILIRDDGCGIAREDLENIFLRHATSKIRDSNDLFNIHSLGFRGEALYSIAAIADVRLKSRARGREDGWQVHTRGGQRLGLEPCAFNRPGTEIEIRELFFNTPARKKFLKTDTTEIHQVLGTLIPYTLLHHTAGFKLTHQERDLLDARPAADRPRRAADVLNLNPEHMLLCKKDFPGGLKIDALLGDINIKRARRDLQFLFVNGRPVQNKNISFHLNQVYRLVFAPQEYPFFIVDIQVPPEEVDVNIHPAKREVKIKNEPQLCSLLRNLVEDTLMSQGRMKTAAASSLADEGRGPSPKTGLGLRAAVRNDGAPEFPETPVRDTLAQDYSWPRGQATARLKEEEKTFWGIPPEPPGAPGLRAKLAGARYIGQFMRKFLLFENGASLIVFDQHAAQERIMYETFIRQMNSGQVEVQRLLSPVVISLNPAEMALWEEMKETLTNLGFDNNQWDHASIAIHTHPALILDIERSARDILGGGTVDPQDHDTLARRACKASVRAGDRLSPAQAEGQLRQLLECLDPFTCPHGRPTAIELTESFLDKQFSRS